MKIGDIFDGGPPTWDNRKVRFTWTVPGTLMSSSTANVLRPFPGILFALCGGFAAIYRRFIARFDEMAKNPSAHCASSCHFSVGIIEGFWCRWRRWWRLRIVFCRWRFADSDNSFGYWISVEVMIYCVIIMWGRLLVMNEASQYYETIFL